MHAADFDACYETIKRAVRSLRRVEPEVYCRMNFAPGEEAQIDFGSIGALLVDGKSRTVWLFAMTLCFSRYSYYELVLDQTVPTFLGAIRRGFEDLGGAPQRIKPDNLKSAVLVNALGERYYQEDFFRFCSHYGCVPDAARPRTPTDKGRTERDIGYVKHGCFEGRELKTEAEKLLREALTKDLYCGPAHNNLGVLYLKGGKLYEAANEFEWAKKLMPGHPDPRVNLALVLDRAGKLDDAMQGYRAALESYPDYLPAMQGLASLIVRSGRDEEKLAGWLDAIALRSDERTWRDWATMQRTRLR